MTLRVEPNPVSVADSSGFLECLRKWCSVMSPIGKRSGVDPAQISSMARNDLDCWKSQFKMHSLSLENDQNCDHEVRYVRQVIRRLCQDDYRRSGRQLGRLADFVEDEGSFSRYSSRIRERLIEQLRQAEQLEQDPMVACPWARCFELLGSRPRLLALSRTLWAKRSGSSRTWRVDLDVLKNEVWGEERTLTTTVRSLTSELTRFLAKQNVPLNVRVSDTYGTHWVECSFPDSFEFELSW